MHWTNKVFTAPIYSNFLFSVLPSMSDSEHWHLRVCYSMWLIQWSLQIIGWVYTYTMGIWYLMYRPAQWDLQQYNLTIDMMMDSGGMLHFLDLITSWLWSVCFRIRSHYIRTDVAFIRLESLRWSAISGFLLVWWWWCFSYIPWSEWLTLHVELIIEHIIVGTRTSQDCDNLTISCTGNIHFWYLIVKDRQ